jgi:hypothetical protein
MPMPSRTLVAFEGGIGGKTRRYPQDRGNGIRMDYGKYSPKLAKPTRAILEQ